MVKLLLKLQHYDRMTECFYSVVTIVNKEILYHFFLLQCPSWVWISLIGRNPDRVWWHLRKRSTQSKPLIEDDFSDSRITNRVGCLIVRSRSSIEKVKPVIILIVTHQIFLRRKEKNKNLLNTFTFFLVKMSFSRFWWHPYVVDHMCHSFSSSESGGFHHLMIETRNWLRETFVEAVLENFKD